MSLKSARPVLRQRAIDAQGRRATPGFGLGRRRLVPAGLATLLASLAFVASAQAGGISVNQSAITSPSDPYYVLDQGQAQTVTIAGTTNADDTDSVAIDCYHDNGSSGTEVKTVAANVTVTNGTFSTAVPIADLDTGINNSQLCRLRAVDTNGPAPTTGLNAFTGPQIAYSYLTRSNVYDFYLFEQQLTGADDYLSIGGCGFDESYTDDATGAYAGHGFFCNDWATVPAASDASESGITVDGEPAYAPDMAHDASGSATGIPDVTINSATQNPTNGDLTLVETEPIVFCQGNPTVATVGSCATFISAGVQDVRTFTQTDDAHVVIVHDAFSSTDATAHSVNLLLENDQAFGTTSGSGDQDYLFPGQNSWVQTSGGESETLPANSIGTIYVRNVNVPDGSLPDPLGAITYFQAPSGPLAFTTTSGLGNETFDAPDHLSLAPSGSATLDYAYATDTTADALNTDVANSKDAVAPPAVTITAPADGATVSATPITVSGTASAGSGVQDLTVDGSPITVANDGNWTTSLTPLLGPQTITASVTSQAGNTASAHETFTYTPPATTTTTATTTTSPATSPAEVDQTTASHKVRGQSAVLGGSIGAHAGTVTYGFQYGPTSTYGRTTKSQTLPASTDTVAVGIAARRLVPGRTYHYRLIVTDSAGRISYGTDRVVHTPRVKPRRIRDHIYSYWDEHAPYEYRVAGRMTLPNGLTHAVACRTRGTVTIIAVSAHKVIARHRVKVSGACIYTSTFRFTATQLPGSGRSSFSMQFAGNSQLRGRTAQTLNVLHGPHKVTQ